MSARYSHPDIAEIRALAEGQGGRVLLVAGDQPPFYAGLRRPPAATLFEAALTFLATPGYHRIAAFTAAGAHLPPLVLAQRMQVGVVSGAWYLRGAPAQAAPAPSVSDPDMLDIGAVMRGSVGVDRPERTIDVNLRDFVACLECLLSYLESTCGYSWNDTTHVQTAPETDRQLVVVDDAWLHPDWTRFKESDVPESRQLQQALEKRFEALPMILQDRPVDLVILCADKPRAEALRRGDFIATSLGDDEARARAPLAQFPRLALPDAPILSIPGVKANSPWGELLPDASLHTSLYDTLRTTPPRARRSPLDELNELVGLESVKRQVRELYNLASYRRKLERKGLPVPNDLNLNTAFYGNPGTGKTTVARILSRIFAELGFLGDKILETTRADFVGEYRGHSEAKTRRVCNSALGGTLFIDEAYGLVKGGSEGFGALVLDELLRFMSEYHSDLAVIVAGYPEPMAKFLRGNDGLERRIGFHIHFEDFSEEELLQIVQYMVKSYQGILDEAARPVILERMQRHREACQKARQAFGNAGVAEKLVQGAWSARASRLMARPDASPEELMTFTAEDFRNARLDPPGGIT